MATPDSRIQDERDYLAVAEDNFYPPGDIAVARLPRESRIDASDDPEPKSDLPIVFRDSLALYRSDFVVVKRTREDYFPVDSIADLSFAKKLPPQTYEDEILAVSQRTATPGPQSGDKRLRYDLLDCYHVLDDRHAWPWSIEEHHPLMQLTDTSFKHKPEFVRQVPPVPQDKPEVTTFMVECQSLAFDIGEVEPMFCTMALYDANARCKISETFHFDLMSDQIRMALGDHKGPKDPVTRSTRALFRVSNPHPEVYLVVKVNRVLMGDSDTASEPYTKAPGNDRARDKIASKYQESCERLGAFRQCFCWSSLPIFVAGQDGQVALRKGNRMFEQLYRLRPDLQEVNLIDLVKDSSRRSKLATIPGTMGVSLLPTTDRGLQGLVDPMLRKYKATARSMLHLPPDVVVREMIEMPPQISVLPHQHYTNLLYVYPEAVNFTNRPGSASCRNIGIRVELRRSDDMSPAGNHVFGTSTSGHLVQSFTTTVTYHNKSPVFDEEIKILLPFPLEARHHLFFTFYHVNVKSTDKSVPESAVGFAWQQIFGSDGIVLEGTHNIPVAVDCKPHYFEDKVRSNLQWVDRQKPTFRFRTKLVSTVYPQDAKLVEFFRHSESVSSNKSEIDNMLISVPIHSLRKMDSIVLVRFFPLIFNRLYWTLSNTSGSLKCELFKTIIASLNNVASVLRHVVDPADSATAGAAAASGSGTISGPAAGSGPASLGALSTGSLSTLVVSSQGGTSSSQAQAQAHAAMASVAAAFGGPSGSGAGSSGALDSPSGGAAAGGGMAIGAISAASVSDKQQRHSIMASYVYYQFDNMQGSCPLLYAHLVEQFSLLLKEPPSLDGSTVTEDALRFSWFFFDIIVKSLALSAEAKGTLDGKHLRQPPAPADTFSDHLRELVRCISARIQQSVTTNFTLSNDLNSTLGAFLRELCMLVDKHLVNSLVKIYLENVTMTRLQCRLLSLVCDHEHYVLLNHPEPIPLDDVGNMREVLTNRHFLAAAIYRPIEGIFKDHRAKGSRPSNRQASALILKQLLQKHECDRRYEDMEARSAIANMYFPLLISFAENADFFDDREVHPIGKDEKRNFLISFLFVLYNMDREVLRNWWVQAPPKQLVGFLNVLAAAVAAFEYNPQPERTTAEDKMWEGFTSASVAFVGLDILLDMMQEFEAQWAGFLSSSHLSGGAKEAASTSGSGKEAASGGEDGDDDEGGLDAESAEVFDALFGVLLELLRSRLSVSAMHATINATKMFVAMFAGHIFRSQTAGSLLGELMGEVMRIAASDYTVLFQGSTRSSRVPKADAVTAPEEACALLYLIFQLYFEETGDLQSLRGDVTSASQHLVKKVRNDSVLVTALQLTVKYAEAERGRKLEVGASSSLSEVRDVFSHTFAEVSNKLDKLKRLLYRARSVEEAVTIARIVRFMKTQLDTPESSSDVFVVENLDPSLLSSERAPQDTDTLEKLEKLKHVAETVILETRERLYSFRQDFVDKSEDLAGARSLVIVLLRVRRVITESVYLSTDWKARRVESVPIADFLRELQGFVNSVASVLRDAVEFRDLQKSEQDPENVADLYYRIAYRAPEDRDSMISWLEHLAEFHVKNARQAEAAVCHLKVADIKAAVIRSGLNPEPELIRTGSGRNLSRQPSGARMSESIRSHNFSEDSLLKSLQEAVKLLEAAQLYERCPDVYDMVIPILKKRGDFKGLLVSHSHLSALYTKIIESANQVRMFGTYYRIGYYGSGFGELNGKEFVYKFPKITMLPEVSNQLRETYEAKFGGKTPIQIIPDGRPVDQNKLDASKAHLQIIALETYFDEDEVATRDSPYLRSNDIQRFMYEIPFTQGGGGQTDNLAEQYKKRIVIKTEHAFPYMLVRIPVVDRQETIIDPIDNSMESLDQRTAKLLDILTSKPPDIKSLQQLLQGSVLVQVNAGVGAIAKAFLESPDQHDAQKIDQLRAAFQRFLDACKRALRLNRSIIESDQNMFHTELEKGYRALVSYLNPLIDRGGDELGF